MKNFFLFFKQTMTVPEPFGGFHIVAMLMTILFSVLNCKICRKADENTYRITLLSIWAIMFVMELIKQITISATFTESGDLVFRYDWGSFPLHLCDSPLYLLPAIALLKDGKVRSALSAFMATYVLLGGVSTYILISTTFTANIYLNVQTLAHHGLQIVAALSIATYNRSRINDRAFLRAIIVFFIAVVIATVYNVVMHLLIPDQVINMFFISPFFKKEMPILNEAWHALHWAPTILLYICGVTFIAFIIHLIYKKVFTVDILRGRSVTEMQNALE